MCRIGSTLLGLLQLIMVFRWNLAWGIPDKVSPLAAKCMSLKYEPFSEPLHISVK